MEEAGAEEIELERERGDVPTQRGRRVRAFEEREGGVEEVKRVAVFLFRHERAGARAGREQRGRSRSRLLCAG